MIFDEPYREDTGYECWYEYVAAQLTARLLVTPPPLDFDPLARVGRVDMGPDDVARHEIRQWATAAIAAEQSDYPALKAELARHILHRPPYADNPSACACRPGVINCPGPRRAQGQLERHCFRVCEAAYFELLRRRLRAAESPVRNLTVRGGTPNFHYRLGRALASLPDEPFHYALTNCEFVAIGPPEWAAVSNPYELDAGVGYFEITWTIYVSSHTPDDELVQALAQQLAAALLQEHGPAELSADEVAAEIARWR